MALRSKQCVTCICLHCEDVGCVECALCKGKMKTDGCSEAIIQSRNQKKHKYYSSKDNLYQTNWRR